MKIEIRKILCPVDFSETSAHATRYGVALADTFAAELVLLHVEEVPDLALADYYAMSADGFGLVASPAARGLAEQTDREKNALQGDLDKAVAALGKDHRCRISTRLRRGKGFLEIILAAKEENVDMIVIGTHGRTGLAHVLMGSTAEKVVRMAPCPVLTVKHPEHEFVMP